MSVEEIIIQLKEIQKSNGRIFDQQFFASNEAIDNAIKLLSRPKGEWIGISYDGYADGNPVYTEWECSNCGLEINDDNGEILWNYCPDCGADMRGEE